MNFENTLEEKIIEYLKNNPGSRGRVIAKEIGADKKKVSRLLHNNLQDTYKQDEDCKWYLKKENNKKITPFAKEVTKYFLEFLETDFKKRRTPKRSLKFRDSDNLKLALNLSQYPDFKQKLNELLQNDFGGSCKIKRGEYQKQISDNLFNLIKIDINEELNSQKVDAIISRIEEVIRKKSKTQIEDPEEFIVNIQSETENIIKRELVDPLVEQVKKSIRKKEGGNIVHSMKGDLAKIVFNQIKDEVKNITIEVVASNEEVDVKKRMDNLLSTPYLRKEFTSFFENFKVNDLFSEFYELKNNQQIKEKIEFYFYFFDVTFDKKTFPLFYTPISVDEEKSEDGRYFKIEFLDKVYINKKAVEYIVEEVNRKKSSSGGSIRSVKNRIIYLKEDDLSEKLQSVLDEVISYFKLRKELSFTDLEMKSEGEYVDLESNYYISLFDKADENLVNDYEALLQLLNGDKDLGGKFKEIINDFIEEEPDKIIEEVDDDWEERGIDERLVAKSPVPLNEEQRKILEALNKKSCNYLLVEGPPGTGKSHTITSIVFEAIKKDLSVLVLSDKTEALDVVEGKITDILKRVRKGKNFQNPILRIGKKKKNLGRILAKSTIKKIRNNYRSIKKEGGVESEINEKTQKLKNDIKNQTLASEEINIEKVIEMIEVESRIKDKLDFFEEFEKEIEKGSEEDLMIIHELKGVLTELKNFVEDNHIIFDFVLSCDRSNFSSVSINDLNSKLDGLDKIEEVVENTTNIFPSAFKVIDLINKIDGQEFNELVDILDKVEELKGKIAFKLNPFKGKEIKSINHDFKKLFPSSNIDVFKRFGDLRNFVNAVEYCEKNIEGDTTIEFLTYILTPFGQEEFNEIKEIRKQIDFALQLADKYQEMFDSLGIDVTSLESVINNELNKISEGELDLIVKYIKLKSELNFEKLSEVNYLDNIRDIQDLSTLQMSYIMDKKLIDFYDKNSSTAKTLQKIIKKGKRFPVNSFDEVKKAFPCILAEIRDYSEYIPMNPDLFDLVIIDEASQVSIAQAFPALIRGKKVAIFGDKKQFGNVKSIQAKREINNEYKNSIENRFKETISNESDKLERLNYIDVKNSVLDLFEFINNYEIQLSKYFRGYREIISFSNRYFYNNSLQVMKIRERPIQEVLKFSEVAHDELIEDHKNTNIPEIKKITEILEEIRESNEEPSVGIITPFRNQQKLLNRELRRHKYSDYFFEDLDLKIMTFDSCQGEERDLIFYSMVANHNEDKLWAIFPSKIPENEEDIRSNLRLQRLNVGFSRAKETMHFILSKQVEDLSCGSVKTALKHYRNEMERAKEEKGVSAVDEKSEMEPKVLNWFYGTEFYKKNSDNIELKPQFELGSYLKQMDPDYNHPEYVVDFLMVFTKDSGEKDKIIIEYDGLKEHFENIDNVNEFNYQDYYKEEDIYRQKVLEGYGYKFLRFNKFNLGDNPVKTINDQIEEITIRSNSKNSKIEKIKERVDKLEKGKSKICSDCGEIKDLEEFRDDSLKTKYGRKCRDCKGIVGGAAGNKTKSKEHKCPVCGLQMVVRNGRYGKFYGCTNFPFCKGTKKYK